MYDVKKLGYYYLEKINCPFELAEGKPAIAIVDNDDFKSDTLTGADQPHRTNVMFVQKKSWDTEVSSNDTPACRPTPSGKLAASISSSLKDLGNRMQLTMPYKMVKRGEPPIRVQPNEQSKPGDTLLSEHVV